MKRLLAILFTIISVVASAQIFNPVDWEFSQTQLSDTEIELQFKANIEDHWHLYSQFTGQYFGDEGPIPTSLTFNESDFFIKQDSVLEEPPIQEYDPIWEETLKYYEGEVTFRQRIKLLTKDPFNITGEINFMLCDEAQCVFPMPVPFSFNINSNGSIQEAEEQEIVTNQDIENTEKYNDKLVDLDNPWEVNKENILYKCGWSPFEGEIFSSKITHTLVNGHIAYEYGKFDESKNGMRLTFDR